MESHIRTNEDFDAFFAECQGETAHAASTIDAEIERLKNELSDCQTAIAQWDAKFEKRRISDDEHEEKVAPHRERIRTIKARLDELEATKPALVEKETMKAIFVSLRDSWDGLDAPARKALVQRLVIELPIRIVVYRGRRVEVQAKQGDVQRSSSLQSQAGE
jgi:chromosome segregation ATPase